MPKPADHTAPSAYVGRDREQALLLAALEAATAGRGGVHLLRGEAGIGKSRTARELVATARARGFAVFTGHCEDGDAAPAYAPWLRALAQAPAPPGPFPRVVGAEDGAGTADGPADQEGSPDVAADRDVLFQHVAAGFREAAATRPQLVLLEDLQWADIDSLRLLQHLERTLEGCAWMAVGTWRSEEPVDDRLGRALAELTRQATTLALGPLDESAISLALAQWSEAAPDPELVRVARERSGGNPLFLNELLALVVAQSGRLSVEAIAAAGVPDLIQPLIDRRIDLLGAETEQLLARAATLGDPFELSELASWQRTSAEDVVRGLEPAERIRLLEPVGPFGDRFRFTHALVRDGLLARGTRAERAARHREVAALLEAGHRDRTEAELARLAEHHRRGLSRHSAERAMECAEAAAGCARRAGAPEQAVRHLRLALDSLAALHSDADRQERRRAELLLSLGEALSQTGQRRNAQAAYREAAEIAQRQDWPEGLARAAIGMVGRDEDTRGASDEMRRWVALARDRIGPDPTALRTGLLALASRLESGAGEPESGEALAREALATAEHVRRPEAWASAAHALHSAIWGADTLAERRALSRRMVEHAERGRSRRTELRARQRLFTDLLQSGETPAADEELARIDALASEVDQPAFRWHALTLAAGCDLFRGRLSTAEERLQQAFEQGQAAGMRNAGALFAVQMFHLREQQGRLGELKSGMQQIVEQNPQVRSLPLIVPLIAMQEGDDLLARTAFEPLAARDFEDVPRDSDWLPTLTAHARVAAHLGDRARCDTLLEKLRPYVDWCVTLPDGQYWEGSVAGSLAPLETVLGKRDEARRHFGIALACARRAGALPLIAHTLCDFARLEADSEGGERAARSMLEEALTLYRQMGVALFERRTERAIEALESSAGHASEAPRAVGVEDRTTRLFERRGSLWRVAFGARRCDVAHRKGMVDLARLLEAPRREIHVLELFSEDAGQVPTDAARSASLSDDTRTGRGPAALPGLDPGAIAQYRGRLASLRSEREDAVVRSDLGARSAIDAEVEWLERELERAFDAAHGQPSAFTQRARKAVYNRLRTAMAAIAQDHPELGRHLRHSIRTGTVCSYAPENPEEWIVVR